MVKRISGRDFDVRLSPRRPGDPAQIVAKADRIRAELGWQPRYDDLDGIVAQALAWEETLARRKPPMKTALRTAIALCAVLAAESRAQDSTRPAPPAKPEAAANASFRSFVDALRPDAEARGVSAATFDAAFRGVSSPDPGILAKTTAQGEFGRPVWDYLVGAVSTGRIARGRSQAARLSTTLAAIEARDGRPALDRPRLLGGRVGFRSERRDRPRPSAPWRPWRRRAFAARCSGTSSSTH